MKYIESYTSQQVIFAQFLITKTKGRTMTTTILGKPVTCTPTRRFSLKTFLARMDAAFQIRKQRRRLRSLPPRLREDIGATEHDIIVELQRPWWNAPAHWLK